MRQPPTISIRPASPVVSTLPIVRWYASGLFLALLLGIMTLALYWPAMWCEFVDYDDSAYVIDNTHVTVGLTWESIKWAFMNPVAGNWHPLTILSHMLDCQLFGLQPGGHHFTSVMLHGLNVLLVFIWLRQMTGAVWRSLLVAALFAVHPLHVESVAWIAERKDVLSAFFGLLTLIFYVRYARSGITFEGQPPKAQMVPGPGPGLATLDYGLALLFLALGLMSKPMLVTWPFVLLLLDYWPLKRFNPGNGWRLVREKIPFLALAVVASVVTVVTQKQSGALQTGENLSIGARGANALISLCRYLGEMFWPTDLAVFYPHPGHWPLAQVLLAGGLVSGIFLLFWVKRRQQPFLLMGWLWYCGTLVPVIGLVQAGDQSMADRYTYLPSLGVLILAVWGGYELTRHRHYLVTALCVAGLTGIGFCLVLTRQQLGFWRDSVTLFQHTLAVTENNHVAHYALGSAYYTKGQTDEAIRQFREAIRIRPGYAEAQSDLGAALDKAGQTDEAISHIQEAIRLRPLDAFPHFNFGAALDKKGQTDEAICQYQEAIRLKPDDAQAYGNLGADLGKQGQTDEAMRDLQEAIRLKPDDAEPHINLGAVLDKKGQADEAVRQYQEAIRLKPDAAEARNNLGYLWASRGENLDQARAMIEKAVQLEPKNAAFLDSLGCVLLKLNRGREALDYQLKAIDNSSAPDASLYDHLGDIYAALKQPGQAVESWHKSLALAPDSQVQKKVDGLSAP